MFRTIVIAATLFASTAHADTKIGIVDVQKAIAESNDGKAALTKLKAEMAKQEKDLKAKRDELIKADQDLQKQAAVLKPEALEKKKLELATKMQQLQEQLMKAQKDLTDKEVKATQPIADKVTKAVTAIAARDKITLIVRKEAVLWPQQTEMDITNEVIKRVNDTK
jgi:outer membrane protein